MTPDEIEDEIKALKERVSRLEALLNRPVPQPPRDPVTSRKLADRKDLPKNSLGTLTDRLGDK